MNHYYFKSVKESVNLGLIIGFQIRRITNRQFEKCGHLGEYIHFFHDNKQETWICCSADEIEEFLNFITGIKLCQ